MGHPEIFLKPDDQDAASYYGFLTVDILPPYNLYNPVLLLRHGKKTHVSTMSKMCGR